MKPAPDAAHQALLNHNVDTEHAAFGGEDDESGDEKYSRQDGGGITNTEAFHIGVGLVIGLNTLLVVVEASMINNLEVKPYLEKLEFAFTMIYVLEVSLKLKEQGLKTFFCARGRKWNIFDLVITVVGFADAVVTATGNHMAHGASAARLFRVMRLMRLVRAARFLGDMETVLKMAGEATLQLGCIVLIVVFISGIITTNMLWDASDPEVSEKFQNLGRSMWTMYSLMTMDNWTEQVMQIMQSKPGMCVFFILYIFIAAITLMSLTPAIFVQLNMFRREQEAEQKVTAKKEAFIRKNASMMTELFKMVDIDQNEMVSMSEMERVIKDKPKMSTLKESSVLEENMLRTVMLSIFDFWDESSFEYSEKTKEFSQQEFTDHIINKLANPQAELLFCGIATRKMVHDLQAQVRDKIDKIDHKIDEAFRIQMSRLRSMIVQANEGKLSPEAEREEELARASLSRSHSRKELDANARRREEKQQEARKGIPSAFLEASILATDNSRDKKQDKGSAWDHVIQRPPSTDTSNPFLQKKKSASELSSGSVPTDQELGPSELAPLVSETRLQDDNVQASQMVGTSWDDSRGTQSSRERASRQPPESEPKGSVRQIAMIGKAQEDRRDSANTPSLTSSWRNLYSGSKALSQNAPGSFHSMNSSEGRNKVGIHDVFRELDSQQNGKAPASQEPPASTRQNKSPHEEANQDSLRIRPGKPPWNNSRNLPPAWLPGSSTTSSTPALTTPHTPVTPGTPGSQRPLLGGSNNNGAPRFWDEDEIKGWIRVTMRMSARFPTVQDRTTFLFRRWEEAKPHFLPEQLRDMEQLLRELVESWGGARIENQGGGK